eukprot:SM000010S04218  [mRNA]  locus=s10:368229:368545:+ [translate_table: standard]
MQPALVLIAICGLARALPSSQGLGALSLQAYEQANCKTPETDVALDSRFGSVQVLSKRIFNKYGLGRIWPSA